MLSTRNLVVRRCNPDLVNLSKLRSSFLPLAMFLETELISFRQCLAFAFVFSLLFHGVLVQFHQPVSFSGYHCSFEKEEIGFFSVFSSFADCSNFCPLCFADISGWVFLRVKRAWLFRSEWYLILCFWRFCPLIAT